MLQVIEVQSAKGWGLGRGFPSPSVQNFVNYMPKIFKSMEVQFLLVYDGDESHNIPENLFKSQYKWDGFKFQPLWLHPCLHLHCNCSSKNINLTPLEKTGMSIKY